MRNRKQWLNASGRLSTDVMLKFIDIDIPFVMIGYSVLVGKTIRYGKWKMMVIAYNYYDNSRD